MKNYNDNNNMISTAGVVGGSANRAVVVSQRLTNATSYQESLSMLWSSKSTTAAAFTAVKRLHLCRRPRRPRHCQHQDVLVASRHYHTSSPMLESDCTVSHLTIASKNRYRQYQQKRYQHNQSSHQPTILKGKGGEAREDPALTWARSNPAEAQACITPPSFPSFHHDDDDRRYNNRYQSLEEYLKWRRWTIPINRRKKWTGGGSSNYDDIATSTRKNRHNEDLEVEQEQQQKRMQGYKMTMISHVLSTPLTLALQIEQYYCMMMTNSNDDDDDIDDDTDDDESLLVVPPTQLVKICCVGARAEASLPDMYWRELLNVVRTTSKAASTSTSTSRSQPLSASIDFIGPDILPMTKERVVTYSHNSDGTETESTITLRGRYQGFFHDYFSTSDADADDAAAGDTNGNNKSKIDDYDFVTFFNPGFGHPNLRNGWNETLRTIFLTDDDDDDDNGFAKKYKSVTRSSRSRVLFFTAHSRIDADRDAKLLKERFGIDTKYTENPFASRIQYLDPCHKSTDGAEHIIRPNQYMAFCVI